jgi:RNA polymerase sigma-70 factor (sigma-E family)
VDDVSLGVPAAVGVTFVGVEDTGASLDAPALERLYLAHHDELVRLARTLVGPASAEDVVHDVFARLYRRRRRLDDPEQALRYVRSAIINGARDRGRRAATAERHRPHGETSAPGADVAAHQRERQAQVIAELRRLPRRQRSVLVLRYYLDMTETQIADELGCSVGTVRTHMKRGRATLAARLEQTR